MASQLKRRFAPGAEFLLVCLLLVYGMYVTRNFEPGFTFAKYDPGWMVTTVISIVEDGDLDLCNQLRNDPHEAADQTSMGINGQWYPFHEFMMPVVTVAFYILFGILGCLIFNVVVLIALMLMIYDLCSRLVDRKSALIAVTLTGFATPLIYYSYSYSLDVFGAFLVVAAYRSVLDHKPASSELVWGIAVLGRTANVITAQAFLIFILLSETANKVHLPQLKFATLMRYARKPGLFLLGVLPVLILILYANWRMFGSPFTPSRGRWQQFVDGKVIVTSQGGSFSSSFAERLPTVLFDRKGGLFFGAPLLLIAWFFGMLPFWRRSKNEAVLYGLICIFMLVLYTKYSFAVPGYPGNRYLMPLVALGAIPLSFAVQDAFPDESEIPGDSPKSKEIPDSPGQS